MIQCLTGHGNSVNDLKVHPKHPSLMLSASKDDSVRLWNIHTGVMVLVFAGSSGHRNEVLSVDFHPLEDRKFVSCGMDFAIKIWSFEDNDALVQKSMEWDAEAERVQFPTKYIQRPLFSTMRVHGNYVDCVRWMGDLVLSKSVDNKILLWRPEDDAKRAKDAIRVIQEYSFQDAAIWFIRFGLDFNMSLLTVGNQLGNVFVWEANAFPTTLLAKLSHPTLKLPIRQTGVSFDGRSVLCCCEDGSVLRWDATPDADLTPSRTKQTSRSAVEGENNTLDDEDGDDVDDDDDNEDI